MTETRYPEPLPSFETGMVPEPVFTIPVLEEGRAALEKVNRELGLAFDEWDLDYYTDLFVTGSAGIPPRWKPSTSPSPTASTHGTGSSRDS